MADVFTKAKRSEIMSKIKSKHTSIEREVLRYMHSQKVIFKKNYKRAARCRFLHFLQDVS